MGGGRRLFYLVFLMALLLNAWFWQSVRHEKAVWANVPPAPGENGAALLALGDRQFAYRSAGIMLQNIGDSGGRATPLREYDYVQLGRWFFLEDALDPRSDFIPLLAAYYFGGTPEDKDLTPVIDYLAAIGQREEGQKWRWLAQAVYLARFRQNDLNRALDLSQKLAAMKAPGMPAWAKQMPAFIMMAQGDKNAALDLMTRILKDEGGKMPPGEINFMRYYICERILTPAEARGLELCAPGY